MITTKMRTTPPAMAPTIGHTMFHIEVLASPSLTPTVAVAEVTTEAGQIGSSID